MQPYQDRPSGSDFELKDLLEILRRQAIPIVVVVVVVLAGFAVHTLRKQDVYQASVTILVDYGPLTAAQSSRSNAEATRTLENEIVLLGSTEVREAVAEEAGHPVSVDAVAGEGSDVLELSARDGDPQAAADDVNAYARAYIDVRTEGVVQDLEQQATELEAQATAIQGEIDQIESDLDSLYAQRAPLTPQTVEYGQLSTEISNSESTRNQRVTARDQLRSQINELNLTIDTARNNAGLEILGEAEAPGSPASPNHRQDMLVGLATALVLAAAVAFVREQLDDSVRTKEELERQTGLPVLGVIPKVTSWKDPTSVHLETRHAPRSAAAEAYRTLLTSLEFLHVQRSARVIQVTSPSAGEGKTTTAANLAVAHADSGKRTLVVDCDLRRPRLHRFFGASPSPGFTSVLLGQVDLDEAVVAAEGTPGLWVLPAGPLPANPAELLRGTRAQSLLRDLRNDYDVVVMDSPPVLPVADALVVSRAADATLIVASSHATTRRRLRRAIENLRQVEAPLVGAVLNSIPAADDYGYDMGYYGYDDRRAEANGSTAGESGRNGKAAPVVEAEIASE